MLDRIVPHAADGVPCAPAVSSATLDELLCGGPALVLAPHPDDESLACGGLLAAAFAGPGAHVVCLTDGAASHAGSADWPPQALSALRRRELEAALTALGGGERDLTWLGLPDAASDVVVNLAPAVGALIETARQTGARSLFAPCETDPSCDYQVAAEVAMAVARMAGLRLWSYPIWSRWRDPGYRGRLRALREVHFDVSPWRERKRQAIRSHRSQLGKVVADARSAFVMPEGFVAMFEAGPEIFFEREPR